MAIKDIEATKEYWIVAKKVVKVPGRYFWSKSTEKTITKEKQVTEEEHQILKKFGVQYYRGYTLKGEIRNPEVEKLLKELSDQCLT